MPNQSPVDLPDEMLHLSLCHGQVRVLICRTTALSREMALIHQPSPVALAACSRIMSGTLMLSVMMKSADDSVTVTVNGDGPAERIVCVGHGTEVKIAPTHPEIDLPLRKDGHLDVGSYIGHHGRLSVIKDLGLREPYCGQISLVSGEIGEDFAHYYTVSEQKPSIVALGALVSNGFCVSAGGVLVQPLPGCSEEILDQLEIRSMLFSSISREVADRTLDSLYTAWFDGLDPILLKRESIRWRCDCSRDKMERALIALGRTELTQMIQEDGGAELVCHFCRKNRQFTKEELTFLLSKAQN